MSNTDIANWIIENSLPNNLNPERINMKIQFSCSQIVGSEYKINDLIDNLQSTQNLLNNYINRTKNINKACGDY